MARNRLMHRAGYLSAALASASLPGFTLCGKVLNFNLAASPSAPPCPDCERIAARKGWKPRRS